MNSSVDFVTSGSALGKGRPVAEDEFASLMISEAGNRAKDAMVCTVDEGGEGDVEGTMGALGVAGAGEAVAEGPLELKSGVLGDASYVAEIFLSTGVCGAGLDACSSSSSSAASKTNFASAILALRTSTLNKHMARSRLGKLIRSSVSSAPREGSSLFTAAAILSFSDPGATDPAGDSVLGGVDKVAGIDNGVEGWSGADAVAFGALGSSEN